MIAVGYKWADSEASCEEVCIEECIGACGVGELIADEPDYETDGFITPYRPLGTKTHAAFAGKHVGIFRSERRALAAIRLEMMRQKFWPNVWSVSDHGNVHGPISVHGGER